MLSLLLLLLSLSHPGGCTTSYRQTQKQWLQQTGTQINLTILNNDQTITIPLDQFRSVLTSRHISIREHSSKTPQGRPRPNQRPTQTVHQWEFTQETKMAEWHNYWFYLMSADNDKKWQEWSNYITSQDGVYWPKLSITATAKAWRNKVTMTKANKKLTFQFAAMTALPGADATNCSRVTLWAWTNSQNHPRVPIEVCYTPTKSPTAAKAATVVIMRDNQVFKAEGVKVHVKGEQLEDFLKQETGIKPVENTYLESVLRIAKTVRKDCVVCLKPKLALLLVQPVQNETCIWNMSLGVQLIGECATLSRRYPLSTHRDTPPTFMLPDKNGSFVCFQRTNCSDPPCKDVGSATKLCNRTINKDPANTEDNPTHYIRSRLWWYCGGGALYGKLPNKWTGMCALVTVVQESTTIVLETKQTGNATTGSTRKKRSLLSEAETSLTNHGVYFDAIGMPRGVPYSVKLIDEGQAAASHLPLISAIFPVMTYKHTELINYLNWKLVVLTNFTELMHSRVAEQLHATSVMALQNRLALDLLLAEKGGLCKFIPDSGECCAFIPLHTAENGSITQLLSWFRTYQENLQQQEGVAPNPVLQWFQDTFGNWKNPVISLLLTLAFGFILLMFISCGCKIAFKRLSDTLDTRINVVLQSFSEQYKLVDQDSEGEEDDDNV
uniref:uncharacterized protein LOC131137848 n=1 Tax=Doryrhamphus excisus TaxID=161450 RepID=UPI0025AE4D46|nr:uncharacterized protein LOC131137848 [Doryrhamphus excisus]